MTPAVLEGPLLAGVVDRLTRPDYPAFEAQLRSSGYCARPVRLQGHVDVCDGHGRRRQVWTTDSEPDGLLRKGAGTGAKLSAARARSATAATPTTSSPPASEAAKASPKRWSAIQWSSRP
jgi:hypothetical protein